MARGDLERLADIRDICSTVMELTARGHDAFRTDPAVRYAIERLLEIIGEAATTVSEETRERYPSVPWRDITRLRVLLAHHYHRTDPNQVWTIAVTDVPALSAALGPPETEVP